MKNPGKQFRTLIAVAAAGALCTFALPASAAVFIGNWSVNPDGSITVAFSDTGIGTVNTAAHTFLNNNPADPNFGTPNGVGSHSKTGSGTNLTFTDIFNFVLPTGFLRPSAISTISVDRRGRPIALSNLLFTSFTFDGVAGNFGTDFNGDAVAGFSPDVELPILQGGAQHLVITGHGGSQASYAGTVTFTPPAVPEPAAWALMIMGFGGIGAMLRRRRQGFAFAA